MNDHRNRIQSFEIDVIKAKNQERDILTSLKQKTKVNIIKNNLRVVGLVNFIVLMGIIFSIAYAEWYFLSATNPKVWIGFLFIHEGSYQNKSSYSEFEKYCEKLVQVTECSMLPTFQQMGLACFSILIVSIVVHTIYVTQIFLIILDKMNLLQKWFCPKPVYLKYFALTVYIAVLLLWGLFCGIKSLSAKKLGVSYWTLCGSCGLYLLLLCYYNIMKKELKKRKMISNLLDAEKYIGGETSQETARRDSESLSETFGEIPVF